MFLLFNILLFSLTLIGGSIPLWSKQWNERSMKYLLMFSGSFLLSITLLHLVPETIQGDGHQAGLLILAGFFLQQIIQVFTHGVEHGHAHIHQDEGKVSILPVFIGLSIHAFSEGLPLGGMYNDNLVVPSLYMAIALHKLPEAMLITSLFYFTTQKKKSALISLVIFSMVTPVGAMLSYYLGMHYEWVAKFIEWSIPVIAGAFVHIATTIFFESGTKSHDMNRKKWLALGAGLGIGLLTILGHSH
jgi:zinc and cadmium transporter